MKFTPHSRLAKASGAACRGRRRRGNNRGRDRRQRAVETRREEVTESEWPQGQRPVRERRHYGHVTNIRRRRGLRSSRLLSLQTLRTVFSGDNDVGGGDERFSKC